MEEKISIEQVQEVQKENKSSSLKFKIVAILNLIFGIPLALLAVLFPVLIAPQLTSFYRDLNTEFNSLLFYSADLFLLLIAVANIYFGIKNIRTSINRNYNFGIIALIITFLFSGYLISNIIISLIRPIYQITSSLDGVPSPTPISDPIATWKTYTNETLGFSLKYPSAWTVEFQGIPQADVNARTELDPNNPYFVKRNTSGGEVRGWSIFLPDVQDNRDKLSLSDWIIKNVITPAQTKYKQNGDSTKIIQNTEIINGKQIITVTGAYNPRANEVLVAYISLDGKIFSLMLDPYIESQYATQEDKNAQENLLEMIATVQLDQNQAVRINNQDIQIVERKTKIYNFSNWKTAKDSSGYNFSYPNNWFLDVDDKKNPAQVLNWDTSKVKNPGAPMTNEMAKWDISFLKKNYTNIKNVLTKEENGEIELIEKTKSTTEKEIYFIQGTAPFFENRTTKMPYIDAIIVEDDKYFVWHGFYSKNEDLEILKLIVETL